MSNNYQNIKKMDAESDPFAKFFVDLEKTDRYWEELARLHFTEKVVGRMAELGVNKTELASRLKAKPSFVTRLLSGKNNFELNTMVRIARALDSEYCSHLHPTGTEALWINVLKEEPVRTPQKNWATSYPTIKILTNPPPTNDAVPTAA